MHEMELSMADRVEVLTTVAETLAELGEIPLDRISEDTQLIGPEAVIKSRVIVELLLTLEEYAEAQLGAEFDWTSDSAMSTESSMFKSVGTLCDHLFEIQKANSS